MKELYMYEKYRTQNNELKIMQLIDILLIIIFNKVAKKFHKIYCCLLIKTQFLKFHCIKSNKV